MKHVEGRVVVSIDMELKNHHTFSDGTKIKLERDYENLNKRQTMPTNAIVISSEYIPKGAEILIHHNSSHDSNRVFDHSNLSGKTEASDVKYFSIPEAECFAWRNGVEWQPLKGFELALRVFKPYDGLLLGIEPTLIEDVLYVTTGNLKGLVVKTLKACDYQIVYQESNGQEGNIIRFRANGDGVKKYEPEAIAVLHELTDQVNEGRLLVGITISDAKPIKEMESVV